MSGPPPRWARILLTLLVPERERDFVLGDLEEGYARRLAEAGQASARLWYGLEVLRSIGPLVTFPGRWRGVMTGLGQDVRSALRVFGRRPGFAAVVVATLGIGVGGATAVYSVLRGVVLTPLAFEDPDRVVMMWGRSSVYERAPLTVGDHNDLARGVDAFAGVAASWGNTALLLGDGEPAQVGVGWVTPEYFDVVGVSAALGRLPRAGEQDAIVIAHDLWVRRWGADPDVLGRTVDLAGETLQVVGVLPADRDPNLSTFSTRQAEHEVWRLQPPEWLEGSDRSVGWLRSAARLRDGVALAQARQEVDALMRRINETVTARDGGTDLHVDLVPVRADLVGGVAPTLWMLLGAVCGVLLVAATNVAHLMLGRAELRGGEVAVRAALGGSRARIIRQMLVESAVLAAVGGIAGLAIARSGLHALLAIAPPSLPRLELVGIDGGVFLFALASTAATVMVFGLAPALRATRVGLAQSLAERRSTGTAAGGTLSRALVVAQIALSLTLVTGTGLLLRSIDGMNEVDLGFDPEGVLTFAVEATSWGDAESATSRMRAYIDRLERVPGVERVGFTNRIPLAGGLFTGSYRSEEMVTTGADALEASFRYVSPDYFSAIGGRLTSGRSFRAEDGLEVVLVDGLTAERAWPGESPLGRRVLTTAVGEEDAWAEVIGVVEPMKHAGVVEPASATLYLPMLAAAHRQNFRYAVVRLSGPPTAYVEALGEAVRSVDANSVMARVRPMLDLVDDHIAATRFASLLLLVFGGVALVLAAVGLHGVMAFSVRSRAREMGIRMALGAERSVVLGSALRSGAILVALGVAVGVVLSLGAGGLLASLLHGVGPRDPTTVAGSAALIAAVGLVGAYLPARLVLAVDPAVTLRDE